MMSSKEREQPLRVTVVSSQAKNSGSNLRARYIAKSLTKAGATVTFVNGVPAMPFMLDYIVSLFTYLRILFIPCDVIVGLKPYPNITILMMVKKLFGAVTVIDIDDLDFGYRAGVISKVNHALQLPFPKHYTLSTYHVDRLRPFIVETFRVPEERLYQLPQGVNIDVYAPKDVSAFKDAFFKEHELNDKKVVVYTAHLNVASDLDAIYEVIARVYERVPSLRFIVIGGGSLEGEFKETCREMGLDGITLFTGYISDTEKVVEHLLLGDAAIVYYKDIKVNYYRESMKLREMLALGLPVVCNDVGDLARFADYTYQTKTEYDAVADALVRVLAGERDGREEKGMTYIREHLDWDIIGARFYERIKEASKT